MKTTDTSYQTYTFVKGEENSYFIFKKNDDKYQFNGISPCNRRITMSAINEYNICSVPFDKIIELDIEYLKTYFPEYFI